MSADGSADKACEYCAAHSAVKSIVITSATSAYVGITNGRFLIRSTGNVSVDVFMVGGSAVFELECAVQGYEGPATKRLGVAARLAYGLDEDLPGSDAKPDKDTPAGRPEEKTEARPE